MDSVLEYGGWIGARYDGELTPLCSAAGNGHVAIVKILLENGADEKYMNDFGMDTLYYASQNGHVDRLSVF